MRVRMRPWRAFLYVISLVWFVPWLFAGDGIPQVAWNRGIGQPLEDAGGRKPGSPEMTDDGYWRAPVGGFGTGTFSRTYRGDFACWHLKDGVHK